LKNGGRKNESAVKEKEEDDRLISVQCNLSHSNHETNRRHQILLNH